MSGHIHSIESFGTVDGPGIRLVVFFQGCPMRCLYCHNPDTWSLSGGTDMTAEEILLLYEKNRAFYKNGGITATGGEPLLQLDFLTELFTKAHKKGIHTCLDTSGIVYHKKRENDFIRLLAVTDLVLLDIKHADDEKHHALTGHNSKAVWHFLSLLNEQHIPVWIRHVLVPGYTDSEAHLHLLGKRLAPYSCIKVLDVLPYHTMGRSKYEALGIDYPLPDVPQASEDEAHSARKIIIEGIRS